MFACECMWTCYVCELYMNIQWEIVLSYVTYIANIPIIQLQWLYSTYHHPSLSRLYPLFSLCPLTLTGRVILQYDTSSHLFVLLMPSHTSHHFPIPNYTHIMSSQTELFLIYHHTSILSPPLACLTHISLIISAKQFMHLSESNLSWLFGFSIHAA